MRSFRKFLIALYLTERALAFNFLHSFSKHQFSNGIYLHQKTFSITNNVKLFATKSINNNNLDTIVDKFDIKLASDGDSIDILDDLKTEVKPTNNNELPTRRKKSQIRQHVNPLTLKYQQPIELDPNWLNNSFSNSKQNISIDIGCSRGSWIIQLAEINPNLNYLGLEIRRPVVELAMMRKTKRNLQNLHFLSTNANIDLERILIDIKKSHINIDTISIQFPDPHFKKKHKKRRVVNQMFVELIANNTEIGTKIFLQSDILEVAEDMTLNFQNHTSFIVAENFHPNNLSNNLNPFKIQTEREIATINRNLPIYRMLFIKK